MILTVRKEFLWFLVLSIPLAVIVGNRGATPDTQVYFDVFKYINNYNLLNPKDFYLKTGMEVGFGWYGWILSNFTSSSFILFYVFSLLNFFFIYKTSEFLKTPFLYCFLFYVPSAYFFMQQFMQMRQGLAISMVIFSILKLFENKKSFWGWLLLITSFFMHQTAGLVFIFAIIFYILKNSIAFSSKNIKLTLLVSFFVFVFIFKFFLLNLLVGSFDRLQSYANTDNYSEDIALFSLPNIRTMMVVVFLLLFSSQNILKNDNYKFFLYLMVVALAARIGFSEFAIMSGRLSTAFSYVEVFILPMILLSRFHKFYCLLFALLYFLLQITITLGFQAPYLMEMYYLPLY